MKTLHYFIKTAILIVGFISLLFLYTCKKETSDELCDLLTCDGNNKPWINNNCSSESSGTVTYSQKILEYDKFGRPVNYTITTSSSKYEISNVTYDQFARALSYSFKITCIKGSKEYIGNISNVKYDNIGQALSYSATINNTSCFYRR
jgi:hypothetical protein